MLNKQHWRYLQTNNLDINEENWDIERAKLELEYNMLKIEPNRTNKLKMGP
jgi:hypothetical protein